MSSEHGALAAVSFDCDGTLWDYEEVVRHSLRHSLEALRRAAPEAADSLTIDIMIAIRTQVAKELKGRTTNLEEMRLAGFARTLESVGIADDDLAAHLNAVYLKHRFEDIKLFDDVLPALDALAQRFTVGLLSNGNSYPERCGLEDRFQFVLFSQDCGIEKPDPRLFEVAMAQARCWAGELLHVGDSLEDDVPGAHRAGAHSAWLNRDGMPNTTGIQPEFEIQSLTELLDICGQLT